MINELVCRFVSKLTQLHQMTIVGVSCHKFGDELGRLVMMIEGLMLNAT